MTQLKAVNETIKMWLWLAKKPSKGKWSYIRTIKVKPSLIRGFDCFLCDVFRNAKGDCSKCPLNTKFLRCSVRKTNKNSPYEMWSEAFVNYDKEKYAMRIVNACRRWKKKKK